jgi:colanic acid/amylovoran biosynthesis protein
MTRIFLTTTGGKIPGAWEHQLGNAAILIPTINRLKALNPNIQITTDMQLSDDFCSKNGVNKITDPSVWEDAYRNIPSAFFDMGKSFLWWLLNVLFGIDAEFVLKGRRMREWKSADVVVSIVGDTYTTMGVGWSCHFRRTLELFCLHLLNIPCVFISASPGPFAPAVKRFLSVLALNRVSAVIVREPLSVDYLIKIGVNPERLLSAACPAFLLSPVDRPRVEEILSKEGLGGSGPVIGISLAEYNFNVTQSASFQVNESTKKAYLDFVTFLLENTKARVVFIPHVYSTADSGNLPVPGVDHRIMGEMVEYVSKKGWGGRVGMLMGLYSPEELKGILGSLDFFIAGRLHAGIGALSQNVPTILISYGVKHRGVAKMLGQLDAVCDSSEIEKLPRIFSSMWERRTEIRRHLQSKTPQVFKLAEQNFLTITSILKSKDKSPYRAAEIRKSQESLQEINKRIYSLN